MASMDEKLSEKQALKAAEEQGIKFVDQYRIGTSMDMLPEVYETEREAELALDKMENSDDYQVIQQRFRAE